MVYHFFTTFVNFCYCPTGSVFCVCSDPSTSTLAVSGGEDDKAYVWKLSDGSKLFECTGNTGTIQFFAI